MPLTKTAIDKILRGRLGCSAERASTISRAIFKTIQDTLASGEDISIRGFGKFALTRRNAGLCRHPVSGRTIHFQSRRIVVFKASNILKAKVSAADGEPAPGHRREAGTAVRRRSPRWNDLRGGIATVRVAGIPVCEFAIKNYSDNGTGFLVEESALILRNIWVGRDIEIKLPGFKENEPSVYQRARVAHVTRCEDEEFGDCFILGIHILSKITVE